MNVRTDDRVKRYEQYGISRDRYMELKFIARQYDSMRKREEALRRGEIDRTEGRNSAWHQPDPTGDAAMTMIAKSFAPKIRAIEDSAKAAAPEYWKQLLKAVTRGIRWEDVYPPCGKNQFYRARRRFFVELDRRLQ